MMKSQFSIITTLIFSIALTACGGGGSGGSTGDVNISRPDTTEDFNFTRELNTITVANQKATDDKGHTSLEAFADAATAENPIDITVQGLAVLFNDSTNYTRTEGVTWLVDDELNPKGLTVTRTATLSRTPILSDTAHLPTVKFISDGTAISAEIYADETYTNTTIDRSTIFGYDSDSNYMAYISWNKAQDADFSETNTSPIKYNKMGMMIAGIETDDDDIPLSGSATFNGKGKGIYDNDVNDNDAGYATIFDVTATVDFGANNVTIASENTKKADNTNVSDLLDFSTTALTYTANNISGTVTASGLSGTLDARFYGGRAWEFGGTFALTDATSYYYGAFGVERTEYFDTFALTSASKAAANPVTATSITAGTNDSLTLVAEAGDNTAFIMDGISVYKDDSIVYHRAPNRDWATKSDKAQTIMLNKLTASGASLTFDSDNKISSVTVYGHDKDYTEANNTDDSNKFDGSVIDVDRKDVFGLNNGNASNYMAYISWSKDESLDSNVAGTTQTITDIDGMMIAGIETLAGDIPLSGSATFNGKGKGIYDNDVNDNDAGYATIFDVTATVNFGAKNVTIASENTEKASDNTDVSDLLDFSTTALTYTANNISGTVTAGDLSGTLDARFYGDAAREFGGTFALTDATSYYYGAFGAERGGIDTFALTSASKAAANPVTATSITAGTNDSLTLVAEAGDGNAFIMDGISVYKDDSIVYHRAPNRDWATKSDKAQTIMLNKLTASGASLTFDSDNDIVSVTVYGHDKDYTEANTTGDSNKFDGSVIDVDRKDVFGLNNGNASNYMAYISWGEDKSLNPNVAGTTQTITDIDGMMIAGIETATGDIPLSGSATFNGKGKGIYDNDVNDNDAGYGTIFDVTATVNFGANNVTIASENTEKASDNTDVSDLLDFSTTALTYTANNISGTVTAGDLSGTLDARFYGDAAREFGGTFALTNATSYYYGAFGAEHGGINTLTFTASTIAEEILNVADRTPGMPFGLSTDTLKDSKANHDMNSLAVYQDDTNAYSRVLNRSWGTADNAQTTEIVRVTNSLGRVQFDNITGNIKEISVYLSGVNYSTIVPSSSSSVKLSATDINRRNGMLLDNVINSDFDATIATLEADRSSGFFGFDTEYMAYIGWHIAQKESDLSTNSTVLTDSIYNKNGMMLAGIETTATDLNAISVNDTTFTGKGSGIYGDANESYKTIFSVIATINFGARNITIKSHDTCKASSCGVKLNSLNFSTSALSFEDPDDATASVNLISGAINTTDTDNNLAGTLDARFYGSSAGEFGGSFALVDTSRYYYGVFGAGRSTTINASIDPIAIIADSKLTTAKETDPALNSTYPTITAGAVAGADYTLKGLGIYGKVTNDHTRIAGDSWTYAVVTRETTITKLSDTRVELTHDDTNGTITNMKVILDDDEGSYNSDTVATPNAYKLTASITSPPADATSTKIDGYRGNKFFGFDSNHMVYSHWNLTRADSALHASNTTDTTYATDGVMIAGLETANGDIPITGSVEFIGKGHGFYSNSDTNTDYQTSFRVKANVTFGESKGSITISSRDTCKIIVNADCTDNGADRVNALNFSTEALNFANINNITGTVTAGDLTGTLDARFYGIGTHAAEEFGGAFAMQNTDESYYGAFGAIEKEFHVFADTATFPKWSDTTTRTMNGLGYTIASDKPLTQTFEITQAHDVNSPNAPKRISAVKINTLDIDGLASNTQNFDQKTSNDYFVMIDDVSPSPRVGDFGNPDYSIRFIHKGTTHNTNRITIVHRPNSGEPWSWNYQTVGIIDDGTAKGGFSTGAFTNDIPTNGNSNFEGYVFGYYKNGDDGYLTRATATVAVDFAEGTANITTSATKRITPPTIEASGNGTAVGGSSFKNASTDNSLNFTGTLRYQELYKWFRGDVSTTDGTTLTSGDATMKAYGPNAEEVGGVFRLQNSDGTKTYAGAFGAK